MPHLAIALAAVRDVLLAGREGGVGQKLFMSCLGEGRPTVILDAPTGATSDVWLSGQLQLASVTRVRRRIISTNK